jgi:hypothetical protein
MSSCHLSAIESIARRLTLWSRRTPISGTHSHSWDWTGLDWAIFGWRVLELRSVDSGQFVGAMFLNLGSFGFCLGFWVAQRLSAAVRRDFKHALQRRRSPPHPLPQFDDMRHVMLPMPGIQRHILLQRYHSQLRMPKTPLPILRRHQAHQSHPPVM